MIPLDPAFFPHVIFIAWGCAAVVVAHLHAGNRRWGLVLIAPVLILIFWRGMPQGHGPGEGWQDLLVIAAGLGLTVACVAVAKLIRHQMAWLSVTALSLIMSIAAAIGVAVEIDRHRIPDMACATNGIDIALDGWKMFLPVEIGAELELPAAAGKTDQSLVYRAMPAHRSDVMQACALTDHGADALLVTALRLNVHNRTTLMSGNCGLSSKAFCEGFPTFLFGLVTGLKVLTEADRPLAEAQQNYQAPPESRDVLETPLSISTRRDDAESFCGREVAEVLISHCTGWRILPTGTILVAQGQRSGKNPEAAVVTHDGLVAALDWLQAKLSPLEE